MKQISPIVRPQRFPIVASTTPPVWESYTSNNHNNTSSQTLSYPSGLASGDLLLFLWSADGNNGLNVPDNDTVTWTEVLNTTGGSGSHTSGFAWTIATGSESGTATITTVSGGERTTISFHRISGADGTTPINTSAFSHLDGSSDISFPDITTTSDDCLFLAYIASESGNSGNPFCTFSAGLTEVYDNNNGPPGNGNASSGSALGWANAESSGLITGYSVNTSSTGSSNRTAHSIAIAPA